MAISSSRSSITSFLSSRGAPPPRAAVAYFPDLDTIGLSALVFQLRFQSQPRVADASAKRRRRDMQRSRDFILRQITRGGEEQRVAQFRRKPANLVLHIPDELRGLHARFWRRRHGS